ncbi:hypothetical protein [Actinokineospora xionganensis]|uniref:Uncharacterized protein n=1 Tax=Actinokineospora xionganensis TaxID=2684470 RepID=A0ABR7KZ22_9PSEU|nr:hypothetical protein [Actinokineospora xionganensis]MBC6445690.1 hypothetical protein [Actinokineospora xionganensis]
MADTGDQEPAADRATVEAVGKLTEALETTEIARGHLYAFHQLTGSADFKVEEAIELLARAGHQDLAARLERELLGRNVLPGRWTFQVVEEYDDAYYQPFRDLERETRELTGGQRHRYEAGLKRARRTPGEPGHEPTPDEPAIPPRSDRVSR